MILLKEKLSIEDQTYLLHELFGFQVIDVNFGTGNSPANVIYTEEGEEFFGSNFNCQFDLDSLGGIFAYHEYINIQKGINRKIGEIKAVLNL